MSIRENSNDSIFGGLKLTSQFDAHVLFDLLVTVKAAPHECVIRTGQP